MIIGSILAIYLLGEKNIRDRKKQHAEWRAEFRKQPRMTEEEHEYHREIIRERVKKYRLQKKLNLKNVKTGY